jgi:hypothetical protein
MAALTARVQNAGDHQKGGRPSDEGEGPGEGKSFHEGRGLEDEKTVVR